MRKSLARLLLIAWGVVIAVLTLLLFPNAEATPNLIPLRTIAHDVYKLNHEFVLNFLGNLAAFLPLGFLLPIARDRPTTLRRAVLTGAAMSLLIELAQLASGRRVPDVDDVLLNTLSTVAGYALYRVWESRRARTPGGPG